MSSIREHDERGDTLKYIIANGLGKFIRHDLPTNRYVEVVGQRYATTWTDPAKALNIKNSLSSALRKSYSLYQIEEQSDTPMDSAHSASDNAASAESEAPIMPPASIVVGRAASDLACTDDDISKWFESIDTFLDFMKDSSSKKEMLVNRLSVSDREISDIYHYIEFNDRLNAYQGWLAYKRLQNSLKKRRKIKRELDVISKLCDPLIQSVFNNIKTSDQLRYEPRVLHSLFEEGA